MQQGANSKWHRFDIFISFFNGGNDCCTLKLFVGNLAESLHDINLLNHVLGCKYEHQQHCSSQYCINPAAFWEIQECTLDFTAELASAAQHLHFHLNFSDTWNDSGAWIMEVRKIQSSYDKNSPRCNNSSPARCDRPGRIKEKIFVIRKKKKYSPSAAFQNQAG